MCSLPDVLADNSLLTHPQQWQNGRRGQDGWGRWTRRRKWYRDAELVEVEDDDTSNDALPASSRATIDTTEGNEGLPQPPADGSTSTATSSSGPRHELPPRRSSISRAFSPTPSSLSHPATSNAGDDDNYDSASVLSTSSRSGRFGSANPKGGVPQLGRRATGESVKSSRRAGGRRASDAVEEEDAASLGRHLGLRLGSEEDKGWGVGDEVRMGLD